MKWISPGVAVHNAAVFASALALLAAAAGMAAYEWTRIKAGRPILKGSMAVELYWVGYLSLFVLGITFALSEILH
ncbi:MAG TPA: hypothetical protein VFX37_15010, partial [Pseudolabrys sp.]|nr:hypothetical protein [Pseudolabrys sp.]